MRVKPLGICQVLGPRAAEAEPTVPAGPCQQDKTRGLLGCVVRSDDYLFATRCHYCETLDVS